jgi:hypothetical protein
MTSERVDAPSQKGMMTGESRSSSFKAVTTNEEEEPILLRE